jgi:hypothetical protein
VASFANRDHEGSFKFIVQSARTLRVGHLSAAEIRDVDDALSLVHGLAPVSREADAPGCRLAGGGRFEAPLRACSSMLLGNEVNTPARDEEAE